MQGDHARNIVGPQVRRLRSAAGISQDDLAARCARQGFDIGRGSVSHIETGLRGVSDLELVLLANALRVKLEELVPGALPVWRNGRRERRLRQGCQRPPEDTRPGVACASRGLAISPTLDRESRMVRGSCV
jgi:transcriptional regulator with XRE-family HTH domain